MKQLLSVVDVKDHIDQIMELSAQFKNGLIGGEPLKKKTLAMIFEKASTRTRISFEVAMFHLGGSALYLSADDLQLGRGELIEDTARAMSRYVEGVMIRAREHADVLRFAENSEVPVINGLTNLEHPCQALADIFTIYEKKKNFELHLTYLGDGNNVCHSLLLASALVGMDMTVICPPGYEPDAEILKKAEKLALETGSNIKTTNHVLDGVKGSDVVYTDVWVSMGNESQTTQRIKTFKDYQVNRKVMKLADRDAMVMHCLPAVRGQEITDEILDGPQSVVWDQAENRLHVQKAVLYNLL